MTDAALPSRDELVARTRDADERLARLLDGIDAEAADTQAGDGWRVKDVVAHLTAWLEESIRRLSLLAAGRGAEVRFYEETDVERLNARWRAERAGLAWGDVLFEYDDALGRLLEAVTELSDEAYAGSGLAVPPARWLANSTYVHIAEHLPMVEATPVARQA